MRLYLVRHAKAGSRTSDSRDIYRPLSPAGRERAVELVTLLGKVDVAAILSSPATRCVQTVEPLAAHLGLEVEEHPDLWEGSMTTHVLALLEQPRGGAVVACSHGDVIPETIEAIAAQGAEIRGRRCEKGSVWVLDHDGDRWRSATYVDPTRTELPASLTGRSSDPV